MSRLPLHPGPKWHFYSCEVLRCGLFYEDNAQTFPPEVADIYCPALGIPAEIRLVGRGLPGFLQLVDRYGHDWIFPVDLWAEPHLIDPQPSVNMYEARLLNWRTIVREARHRLGRVHKPRFLI